MKADLKELEAALGHEFSSPELLVRALTHRSLAHQIAQTDAGKKSVPADNERLEYLGDAVLGLVVAETLFTLHPEWREGELTRIRSGLVSRQHMAQVAEAIGLGRHLRLSRPTPSRLIMFRMHAIGVVPLLQPDVNGRTGILGRPLSYHCLSLPVPMDGTGRAMTRAGISPLLFPMQPI